MAGRSPDQITEWEGGSLAELVAMLQAAALPVRIDVIAPGAANSSVGEVHLLAGGMADAFAGSLRREDAMAALQRLEGARFVVESRLPNPETGSLSEPGPHQGGLNDRPLASLMRYCEDYVLTCRLEVWRGQDRAVISYRRGEIIGIIVGGSDAPDRLPEVLAWVDGSYEIILPAPVLPQLPSSRRREAQGPAGERTPTAAELRPERKRHTTLPMAPTVMPATKPTMIPTTKPTARSTAPAAAPAIVARPPGQPVPSAPAARLAPMVPARPAPVAPPPVRPTAPAPAQPLVQPSVQPARPASASRATPAQPGAAPPRVPIRPAASAAGVQAPTPVVPKEPLQTDLTTRGTPPVPPVPQVPPRSTPQPGPRPTGLVGPAGQGSTAAPSQGKTTAPVPGKPATPTAPAVASPSVPPTAPPQPAARAQSPSPPNAPPSKTAAAAPAVLPTVPPASNDLKPTSGTIDAKPKHAAQHPPAVAPIEVADQPAVDAAERIAAATVVPTRSPTPGRRRRVARKGLGEHTVRTYVFVGLAIGVGIVLAYCAYWYLPLGHH